MESIGQILKAAREHKSLTIAEVALAIKAKQSFVVAIESDKFDNVIAPVYAKGFIKLYAEHVGVDSRPLLRIYQHNLENPGAQPATVIPPPAKTPAKFTTTAPLRPATPTGQPTWHAPATTPTGTPVPVAATPPPAAKQVRSPRVRQPLRVRCAPLINRWAAVRQYDWSGMARVRCLRLRSGWRKQVAIGTLKARAAFKRPRVRKASGLAAIIILAGLLGMFARQASIERRLHYTPSAQAGWLRPPPEPYP